MALAAMVLFGQPCLAAETGGPTRIDEVLPDHITYLPVEAEADRGGQWNKPALAWLGGLALAVGADPEAGVGSGFRWCEVVLAWESLSGRIDAGCRAGEASLHMLQVLDPGSAWLVRPLKRGKTGCSKWAPTWG